MKKFANFMLNKLIYNNSNYKNYYNNFKLIQ